MLLKKMLMISVAAAAFFAFADDAWAAPVTRSERMIRRQRPAQSERRPRGNLYETFLGKAPRMPTERGLLIIYAFHDRNGNQQRDSGEELLRREIVCMVDNIGYQVPAFIPGLKLNQGYTVNCVPHPQSGRFKPINPEEDFFVVRRGQVFEVNIPCRPLSASSPGNTSSE